MTYKRFKRGVKRRVINQAVNVRNFFLDLLRGKQKKYISEFGPLAEVQKRGELRTDICDHLPTLFAQVLASRPKLIVELGVRGGESTFVFERAAQITNSSLLSVDMNDCRDVSNWSRWNFVQSDDIKFAKEFPEYAAGKGWEAQIDLLFIDTSHEYNHTVAEINAWFPYLSSNATVIFHDTNLRELYKRRDGSWGLGWDNERGVIRAIEEYVGKKFQENKNFVEVVNGWVIQHEPVCQGFTILKKYGN
ncbi:MAG: class I SAM-dependent methyltransferase [Candidatus Doudnabacteria bacterium]|nr:class I SAM-dependent methyltransferase [Candidatus Doudnabacteria bacterium]